MSYGVYINSTFGRDTRALFDTEREAEDYAKKMAASTGHIVWVDEAAGGSP